MQSNAYEFEGFTLSVGQDGKTRNWRANVCEGDVLLGVFTAATKEEALIGAGKFVRDGFAKRKSGVVVRAILESARTAERIVSDAEALAEAKRNPVLLNAVTLHKRVMAKIGAAYQGTFAANAALRMVPRFPRCRKCKTRLELKKWTAFCVRCRRWVCVHCGTCMCGSPYHPVSPEERAANTP